MAGRSEAKRMLELTRPRCFMRCNARCTLPFAHAGLGALSSSRATVRVSNYHCRRLRMVPSLLEIDQFAVGRVPMFDEAHKVLSSDNFSAAQSFGAHRHRHNLGFALDGLKLSLSALLSRRAASQRPETPTYPRPWRSLALKPPLAKSDNPRRGRAYSFKNTCGRTVRRKLEDLVLHEPCLRFISHTP